MAACATGRTHLTETRSPPGPYRIRIVQLVPDWVKSVTVYGATYRPRNNLIVDDVGEPAAIGYQAFAGNGKLRDQFSAALPPTSRQLRIFRMPLSHPRSLTADEQALVSRYLGESWIGAIPSKARRFGGSDWVAVPGRFGFAVVDLTKVFALVATSNVGESIGADYGGAAAGGYLQAGLGCGTPDQPAVCGPDVGRFVDFVQLLPDNVGSERVGGDLYAGVDGLVWGTIYHSASDTRDPLAEIDANIRRWQHRRSHRPR